MKHLKIEVKPSILCRGSYVVRILKGTDVEPKHACTCHMKAGIRANLPD